MKKLFVLAIIGASLLACNENTDKTNKTDATSHEAYAPADGDVSYRNGKVLVWRNNEWVDADDDVRLDNGVVVRRNGEVVRNDEVIVLKDGEVVNKSGRFFDKAGNAIDDAWHGAKKGVTKAGEGVKKAGEEVKEVFTGDDKNDKDKKKDKDKDE